VFCRHGRREDRCPICAKAKRQPPARSGSSSGARSTSGTAAARPVRSSASGSARRSRGSGDVRVRKLSRHADDGWRSDLLPGVLGSAEALELCRFLLRARLRLEALAGPDAPGPYGRAATLAAGTAAEREEAAWLLFQVAYYGPVEGDGAFLEIARLAVDWTAPLPDDATLRTARVGPRGAHDHARGATTIVAYREWAQRAGGQLAALGAATAGQSDPARRFDAAFRALALPGLSRGPRFELLLSLAAVGLLDAQPWSLLLDASRDPVGVAAKRAFRSDDGVLLQRRLGALARALALPVAAFDLGLRNWDAAPKDRLTGGVPVQEDPDEVALLGEALGIVPDAPAAAEADAGSGDVAPVDG
jgi:hypothetical protein